MMARVQRATAVEDWDAASAVLSEYVRWIRTNAGFDPLVEQPGFATELASLPARYSGPDAVLFIAYLGEVAVGTVAVCRDGEGGAEIKRMYVRPVARGRGVADALIAAALGAAAEQGCGRVWLESIRDVMDPAIAVYRRNGFAVAGHRLRTLALDGVVVMERVLEPAHL
jgi:GNAT superfamily N-acetyltransferase